ncbi:MAG: zinc-ribbon domain-containing protein [Deltaproteobacteria bacterium]|jgi:transposase-like protein|nr:zinc-ribbon domain-containing protein [Deltaproteobacteria bacterium]
MIAECPHCHFQYTIGPEHIGQSCKCQECGNLFELQLIEPLISLKKEEKQPIKEPEKVLCTQCPHCKHYFSVTEQNLKDIGKYGKCYWCDKEFKFTTTVSITAKDHRWFPLDKISLYSNSVANSKIIKRYVPTTQKVKSTYKPPGYSPSETPKPKDPIVWPKWININSISTLLVVIFALWLTNYCSNQKKEQRENRPAPATYNTSFYIKKGAIVAISESYLDMANSCVINNDNDCIIDLMLSGRIQIMHERMKLDEVDTSFFKGRAKIRFRGEAMYKYTIMEFLETGP